MADALEANKNGILNLGGAILDNHEVSNHFQGKIYEPLILSLLYQSRRMEGSVLVLTAESSDEIEKMILKDPYYMGKVWESWDILPVNM